MNSESDNYEATYCADDYENRVYCEICDKLRKERYYKNNLNLGTHTNKFYKRQRWNNTNEDK